MSRSDGNGLFSSSFRTIDWHHFRALSQHIEMVAPPLGHFHPLLPVSAARVVGPHLVGLAMGKCPLDCVGVLLAAFVQKRCGHGPEPVGGHFVAGIAQPPQSGIQSVLAHGAGTGADRRKDIVGAGSGNRTRLTSLEGWGFTTKLYPLAPADCHGNGSFVNPSVARVLDCAGALRRKKIELSKIHRHLHDNSMIRCHMGHEHQTRHK